MNEHVVSALRSRAEELVAEGYTIDQAMTIADHEIEDQRWSAGEDDIAVLDEEYDRAYADLVKVLAGEVL